MTLKDLEKIVVKAFCDLDTLPLKEVDENAYYSHNDKEEFIDELNKVFNKIKTSVLLGLEARPSNCEYCYPNSNAYSFHDPSTGDFIVRYVIHHESKDIFRVEECRNLPARKDGMPF